jgi:c-di-GMP-binding flagellar brake protein YcgR
MNEAAMLSRAEPREILRTIIEKKIPGVLSYLSKGKWHIAKVLLTNLGDNSLDIRVSPRKMDFILQKSHQMPTLKPPSINIQVNQPVGISLKYGYGKFIFETTVVAIQPSTEPTSGPTIVLMVPERIELVQRRSYFRVDVPSSLKVNVMLWHRGYTDQIYETQPPFLSLTEDKGTTPTSGSQQIPQESYWQGKLIDISAGGLKIVVDHSLKPHFKRRQIVGLRFTPLPYEMPLMFDAQIRNILPTADHKSITLGLRIVGLEASAEGRQVLQRLCNVTEFYYQLNQCSAKGRDFQTTGAAL